MRSGLQMVALAGLGAMLGCGGASTVTTGNPPVTQVGTLAVASTTAAVAQSAGSVTVMVNRTGGSSTAVTASYTTADGTALAGVDYTKTTGTLSWADGDAAAKPITVPLTVSPGFTGAKTFTVSLSATAAVTITSASATISISGGLLPPSNLFSFTFPTGTWKLTLPIDQYGGTGGANNIQYPAVEIKTPDLTAGYVSPYFYADTATYANSTNHVVFMTPSNGASTSPGSGSDHTRSELRELYTGPGADSSSDWNSSIGGTLTASCIVQAVSASSDEATIGQIHNQSYVFMLLIYRPAQKDIAVDIYSSYGSSTHSRQSFLTNVNPGDPIAYTIAYKGSTIAVTVNGTTKSYPIDPTWANTPMYFKLGAYHAAPNIGNPAGDKTQVAFSSFSVTH